VHQAKVELVAADPPGLHDAKQARIVESRTVFSGRRRCCLAMSARSRSTGSIASARCRISSHVTSIASVSVGSAIVSFRTAIACAAILITERLINPHRTPIAMHLPSVSSHPVASEQRATRGSH
jgi:hypothetical protein